MSVHRANPQRVLEVAGRIAHVKDGVISTPVIVHQCVSLHAFVSILAAVHVVVIPASTTPTFTLKDAPRRARARNADEAPTMTVPDTRGASHA